ncbi:MAG TPA: hypothetical protein PLL10_10255, partial [Elusimicrobiales bacterium]|nr:hypothetical protein [Elusimicrobiales bacterium]
HVSKDEQKRRFLERITTPEKRWKFSSADIRERAHWEKYEKAFDEAITATSTEYAPWHIIPADKKWFSRAAVSDILVKKLESLHLKYPVPVGWGKSLPSGIDVGNLEKILFIGGKTYLPPLPRGFRAETLGGRGNGESVFRIIAER